MGDIALVEDEARHPNHEEHVRDGVDGVDDVEYSGLAKGVLESVHQEHQHGFQDEIKDGAEVEPTLLG